MRAQFIDTVLRLASADPKIQIILGDISVFLFREFQAKYPDQIHNVGICENTLISLAAGMSSVGLRPFVHTIGPFIVDRSFEHIKLDMCYNAFGGNIVTCGASYDYAWDGSTHHCPNDLLHLSSLPNCEVMQPGNKHEVDALITSQYANHKTSYYRVSTQSHSFKFECEFGKAVIVKDLNAKTTIMTAGPILQNVNDALSDLPVNIVYFHTLKPIDVPLINRFKHTQIIVIHDALGLLEILAPIPNLRLKHIGLPDEFLAYYGHTDEIHKQIGLDPHSIRSTVQDILDCV
jgi:transketolase